MSSQLFSPALAFVAFVWIMWVTVPWAFEDKLNLNSLDPKVVPEMFRYRFEREINLGDVRRVADWLGTARDAFLGAGAFFMLSAVADLFSAPVENYSQSVPEPFSWSYLVYAVFISGLFVTAYGVYKTQQVITFIANPSQIDKIAHFGLMFRATAAKTITIAFVTINAAFETTFGLILIPIWFTQLSFVTILFRLLDASLFLGVIGIATLLRSRSLFTFTKKDTLAPILVVLPYAIIALVLVLSRTLT